VVDVPVRPVYGPGWRSGIRVWTVVYPVSFLLLRAFFVRVVVDGLGMGRLWGKRRRIIRPASSSA
jgi:hypothetical protein